MVELVDTSDLKSEGDYLRPGSSPGLGTNTEKPPTPHDSWVGGFFFACNLKPTLDCFLYKIAGSCG